MKVPENYIYLDRKTNSFVKECGISLLLGGLVATEVRAHGRPSHPPQGLKMVCGKKTVFKVRFFCLKGKKIDLHLSVFWHIPFSVLTKVFKELFCILREDSLEI